MTGARKSSKSVRGTRKKHRLTIGVLVSHLTHTNDCTLWQGVVEAAKKRDVTVICFVGLWLRSPHGPDAQANMIYDLVSAERLDGLIIAAGAITQFVPPEEKRAFIERYRPLPVVTLESDVPGTPDISVDSFQNMRKAVLHLIRTHHYRRIAFIRGPENHRGANERYRAYVETLAEHDIPRDPALVTPPLNWYDGRQGLSWLLDRHVDFEAVIGANDDSAIGAIEELRARGIRVPQDVAVVGYDDAAASRWITPPLTTVPIETYKWGRQALTMVLDLIEGGAVPDRVVMPAEIVIRQSCGCLSPAVEHAAAGQVEAGAGTLESVLASRRAEILSAMARAVGEPETAAGGAVEILLDCFVRGLNGLAHGLWIRELNQALLQTMEMDGDLNAWQEAISTLRRQMLPFLEGQMLARAEDLWQQARVAIGEMAPRAQAQAQLRATRQAHVLREIGAELISTFDLAGLMNVLAQGSPRLGIPGAFLSLYQDPQSYPRPAPDWSRLVMACRDNGRLELAADGERFPTRRLLPDGLWPSDRAGNLVVQPLYFQEHQLGFVAFEAGPREGDVYEILRRELSSALQGALLMRRVWERSSEVARQHYILDAFMENLPDSIYFKDLRSRITRANKAHALKVGLTDPAEEIGKSDFDFFPEEQARVKYEQEQEIIRTGEPLLNVEEPDGVGAWSLTTKMPLRNERGEILGTFGVSRDVTALKNTQAALERAYAEVERQVQERTAQLRQEIAERTHAEEEVQRLNTGLEQRVMERTAQLEASNKELEAFSYSVSHDLRAPLRALDGFSRILLQDYAPQLPPEVVRYLTTIRESSQRMGRLIDDLLAFSRLSRQPLSKQPVVLADLVRDALQGLASEQEGRRIDITIRELPPCQGDLSLLRQVWFNLLSNALKFTRGRETARIEIGCTEKDGEQVYSIEDNGVGFDTRYADKLFGVFQRLHRDDEFEGSGIGLAIVQRIIHRHGGRVWAESSLGKGSRFYFTV